MTALDTDVVVVGGGPVGLALGCMLARREIDVIVLERAPAPAGGSRSIGVHPPSLERLALVGVTARLCREGVRVRRGRVLSSRGALGAVDLTRRPGPYRFVLAIPQARTERALEDRLAALAPLALRRGISAVGVARDDRGVCVRAVSDERPASIRARFVVGCDGRNSTVRRAAGIDIAGAARPEAYLMGDFADGTGLGADAAFFLADDGLVESFPLPGGIRRWVVEAGARRRDAPAEVVAERVFERTGHRPDPGTATMASAFGVEQRRARQVVSGRTILAGDAAHVVSPFGGQGMNLGLLDAWDLAETLAGVIRGRIPREPALRRHARRRRRAARRALTRAAVYGAVGRRREHPGWRNAAVAAALAALPDRLAAPLVTMRGID